MSKQYPNIGGYRLRDNWKKNPKAAPKCIAIGCECKATHRVEVQVNWFRGDDESGNACPQLKGERDALKAENERLWALVNAAQAKAQEGAQS